MISEMQIAQAQQQVFDAMGASALEKLVVFLRGKAELAAYVCSQIGAPEDVRRDMLATIRFCHGFADKAEEALSALKEAATSGARGDST